MSGENEDMKDYRSSRKRKEGQNYERVSHKVIYLNTVKKLNIIKEKSFIWFRSLGKKNDQLHFEIREARQQV